MARSANRALVDSIYRGWTAGNYSDTSWAHPEIEFDLRILAELGSRTRGIPAMSAAWFDYLRAWEGYRVIPTSFRELDDGRLIVMVDILGRGRSSGVELGDLHTGGANVFAFRDGRVSSLTLFVGEPDDDARAELGIPLL